MREPTQQETDTAVDILAQGNGWDEVGQALGMGKYKARHWLRGYTTPRLTERMNAWDPKEPRHGTSLRYYRATATHYRDEYACFPEQLAVCDACLHANSKRRTQRHARPKTDETTLERVAQYRASGTDWYEIGDAFRLSQRVAVRAWRGRVLPRVSELMDEQDPQPFSHGLRRSYRTHGCRCPACRDAYAEEAYQRRVRRVTNRLGENDLVDARKAIEHVDSLLAQGATYASIAQAANMSMSSLYSVMEKRHEGDFTIVYRNEQALLSVTLPQAMQYVVLIPADLSIARLRRMDRIGWTRRYIADRLGMTKSYINQLMAGGYQRVRSDLAQMIASLDKEVATEEARQRASRKVS